MLATMQLEFLQQWMQSARQLIYSNIEAADCVARVLAATPLNSNPENPGRVEAEARRACALVVGPHGTLSSAICGGLAAADYVVIAVRPGNGKHESFPPAAARGKPARNILDTQCDVFDPTALHELVRSTEHAFGGIDVLVNALPLLHVAGEHRAWGKTSAHVGKEQVLESLFKVTRAVLHGMKRRGYGRIINLSRARAASSPGLLSFTRALAREVAGHGVTVNSLSPVEPVSGGPDSPQTAPESMAQLIVFLAAGAAVNISGMDFAVSGGSPPARAPAAAFSAS